MDTCLIRLSDVCYEIEGIIALLKERGGDSPQDIYRLLQCKTHELCEMVDNIHIPHEMPAAISQEETITEAKLEAESDVTEALSGDADDTLEFTGGQSMSSPSSNDIRKEFTINDKFRFRRELFGNSDTEMTDTLNLISAMSNIGEVEEYFYHDMEWEKDNEEVLDFMSIIANYFNYKKE